MLLAQFGKPVRLIIVFLIACTLVIIKAAEDKNAEDKAEKAALSTAKYLWNFLSGIAKKHNLPKAA